MTKKKSKASIEVDPAAPVQGDFVTVTLIASGDEDELGNVTFVLDQGIVQTSTFLGPLRSAGFYTQSSNPATVSFTDDEGETLASAEF